ncbi:MAG: PAS domain-containing protein [Chloroflexi bacterium]|nr:PAS domain-containing protein [Chloroflexota bacterium]MBP8055843.1 PAS domain-containing protein [Chloroflexota bacterium]
MLISTATLYLIPYFLSCTISLWIGLNAWRHREENAAAPFAWIALSQAATTIGYILELLSPTIPGKIFWDNLQFVGLVVWPLALFAFALQYTGQKLSRPRLLWTILALPGILVLAIIFTDPWHSLIRPTTTLIPGEPFPALVYTFTPTILASFSYFLLLMGGSLLLLLNRLAFPQRLYRAQILAITIGTLVPVIGLGLTALGIQITFHRDTTPLTYAVSNLIIAWALFRYKLFDVVPVAREAVIENMTDAVLVLDRSGRVIDYNPSAITVLQLPVQGVIGTSITNLTGKIMGQLPPDLLSRNGSTEQIIKTATGEHTFEVDVRPLPARRGRESGHLIIWHDISERKQAEEAIHQYAHQLEEANRHLSELSQLKDQFVANVSHELRTPIANIKLSHELIAAGTERTNYYLDILQREVIRLENLIEDLLTLSRLDQGRIDFHFFPLNLDRLLQEYVIDRRAMAEQKELTLTLQLTPDLSSTWAESRLVGQVLSILLTNALNYTPAGGQITIRTVQKIANEKQWVGFQVQDTGPGITPADQAHLFERFFRGTVGQKSGAPGTGLGLAIAQEIMRRHAGCIEVQSSGVAGEGTTFSVWLPVIERNELE